MEPLIGQVILFAGNFAPRGWAFCHGQLLDINSNQALFSILGTTYGGDGRTTFGLPDLRGRTPIGAGRGAGLSDRRLGERGGAQTNTLNTNQLPPHSHPTTVGVATSQADDSAPDGRVLAGAAVDTYTARAPDAALGGVSGGNTGAGQPVNNMPPYTAMNYIIALIGIFPSRN